MTTGTLNSTQSNRLQCPYLNSTRHMHYGEPPSDGVRTHNPVWGNPKRRFLAPRKVIILTHRNAILRGKLSDAKRVCTRFTPLADT